MATTIQIRTLLAVVLSLLALLLFLVGFGGVYGIHSTNRALSDTSDNVPTVIAVQQQREFIAQAQIELDRMAAAGDATMAESRLRSAQALIDQSDKAWATYLRYPSDAVEKRLADAVMRTRRDLIDIGLTPTIAALRVGDRHAAVELLFDTMPRLYRPFSDATGKLSQFQVDDSAELLAISEAREKTTSSLTISATLVGLLCAFGFWFMLRRAIAKPLSAAIRHFGAIEKGDLTSHIEIVRADEFGALLGSLRSMQMSLRDTVSTVRDGVDHVADAAVEIAAGSDDLSKRTERQASSLEETAASMEELSATVQRNAASAGEANLLADAVKHSARGVADAVTLLSKTMKELEQGSGTIAEITAVIESIAFQTNILALNAAVEAARAGERGRGFAVVATEVRALAKRSSNAAKEIKEQIDGSVLRVKRGATQADGAFRQMIDMLASTDRVANLLGEIADASSEQAHGILQVTAAIAHMDQVTQQNAALVDEGAAASSLMNQQANRMREVVAGFRF